jgi:arabinosaccharide transport system substrate-binding protein
MMWTSRWMRAAMLMLALALIGTACSGGEGLTVEEGAEGEAQASGEPAASEPAAAAPSEIGMEVDPNDPGEPVELSFWTFVNNHADFLIAKAEEFNAQNDEFNVIINASVGEYAPHHERLLLALQSGTGAPDLVDIEIARFGTFTRGNIQLHPLTDVVDRHREELVEERLAPYQFEGEEYGIDYHLGAFVMYYNADVMEEAGVDVDSIETWDDYIEAGKQVVENTDALMTTIESIDRFSLLGPMLQNGGGLYDENNELIMDSPENVEAVEKIASMIHEHEIAETPPGGYHHDPTYFENFNAGQYASVWMPQWYMIRFKDQMPDTEGKLLVRPLPAFEEGGAVSTMGGGTGTAITTQVDDAKLDVAKDFLEFAKLTHDAQVSVWTELGFDPFRDDAYEDPALAEPDPWFSDEPVMADLTQMFDRLVPEYTGPRYPEAVVALNEQVAFNVIAEGASAQETLSAAAEEIRALDQ